MINKESLTGQKIIEDIRTFTKRLVEKGQLDLCFTLVMREEGELKKYDRIAQPCYGELRTYHKTHPDYSDPQPHDEYRPNDLHAPFPAGTPEILGVPFYSFDYRYDSKAGGVYTYCLKKKNERFVAFTRYLFSSDSPWAKGLGSDIEIVEDDNYLYGVILYDTEFDPTVLVNLLNNFRAFQFAFVNQILEVSDDHLVSAMILTNLSNVNNPYPPVPDPEITRIVQHNSTEYYNPTVLDIRRFVEKNPNDLTGGTFRNRFAYNRKILHNIFAGEGEPLHKRVRTKLELKDPSIPPYRHRKVEAIEIVDTVKQIIEEERNRE